MSMSMTRNRPSTTTEAIAARMTPCLRTAARYRPARTPGVPAWHELCEPHEPEGGARHALDHRSRASHPLAPGRRGVADGRWTHPPPARARAHRARCAAAQRATRRPLTEGEHRSFGEGGALTPPSL